KAHVPAGAGHLKPHLGVPLDFPGGKAFRGQERIVGGIDDQRGYPDVANKTSAAAARPIILGVAKAMQGRGEAIIEFLKSPQPLNAGEINLVWKTLLFQLHFLSQTPD